MRIGGFTPFDEKFVPILNLLEAQLYNRAAVLVEELKTFLQTYQSVHESAEDLHAELLFVQAKVWQGLKKYREAKDTIQQILAAEMTLQEEKWVIPHSLFMMGEILVEMSDFDHANSYFLKAKHYPSGYHFDRLIQVQIMQGIQKIQKKKANNN